MTGLLAGTFLVGGLHTLLWLPRALQMRRELKARRRPRRLRRRRRAARRAGTGGGSVE